jgi:hypothetical protein
MVLEHFYEPDPNATPLEVLPSTDCGSPRGSPSGSPKGSPRKKVTISPPASSRKKEDKPQGSKIVKGKGDSPRSKAAVEEKPPVLLPPAIPMREKENVDLQKIVANKYVLDFENVRLGFAKRLTIRVSTGGYLPVSFKVDKTKAKGLGFSIEPDGVINLPAGHSVPQTAELHITFNTSGPKFPVGQLECWVPINLKEVLSENYLYNFHVQLQLK